MAACDASICRANYESLRLCAANEKPIFDPAVCCVNCRVQQPNFNAACTPDQIKACITAAPVCAAGEAPFFDPTVSCCASCVRPAALCAMTAAGDCFRNARPCDANVNEVPQPQTGSCCMTCKPAAPTCNPVCTDAQICAPSGFDATGKATFACRNIENVVFNFVAQNTVPDASLSTLDAAALNGIFRELVARYCEQSSAEDMCAKHLAAVFVSVCSITRGAGTRDIEITCKLPAAATPAAAAARATTDSPAGLATASVSAANNDQFKVTAAPAPTSTSAAAVFAPIAVLVALFAVVASML